jgi:hypothetical protein
MQNYKNTKDSEIHYQLKADLIEHLWQNHSELYNIDYCWLVLCTPLYNYLRASNIAAYSI